MTSPNSIERKTVLVTRPKRQADGLRLPLERAGFDILYQPVIDIVPLEDTTALDLLAAGLLVIRDSAGTAGVFALETPKPFDWLLFSSANGVEFFCERLRSVSMTDLAGILTTDSATRDDANRVHIAVMGPGTAAALPSGLVADLEIELHQGEGMVAALENQAKAGARFLSVRGSRGRDVVKKELTRLGGIVGEIAVYRSLDVTEPDPMVCRELVAGRIDAVTVTSSSIAAGLVRMFGESLRSTRLVSIGPVTTATLTTAGFPPAKEAESSDMPALARAIVSLLTP